MHRPSIFLISFCLLASALLCGDFPALAQDAQDDLGLQLHSAAEICDMDAVRSLVKQGVNVNYPKPTLVGGVQTPLQSAILALSCLTKGAQLPVVKFLLEHGAVLEDLKAGSALQFALMAHRNDGQSQDQVEVVQLLLAHGANVRFHVQRTDGITETLLHTAVYLGDIESIKLLIRQGIDVNAKDSRGKTALESIDDPDAIVADFVKKDMARILKKAGAK